MSDFALNLALGRLQQLIGWVGVLVTVGAAVMAASYLHRTRWAAALAGGLALLAMNGLAGQVLIPWIIRANPSNVAAQVGRASFGMSVLGLIALVTLVLGVIGTLSELSHAKRIREP